MGLGSAGWSFPVLEPVKAVYQCDNVHTMVLPIRQNLGPSAAFRAPGVMEGTWALENAMDELAEKLAIDPLELRRRNHADRDQGGGQRVLVEAAAGVLRPRRAAVGLERP